MRALANQIADIFSPNDNNRYEPKSHEKIHNESV